MKIFNITIFPLAAALILGGAVLATKDHSTTEADPHNFDYTVSWGFRSFDETVWLAVDDIARIEENLPEEVGSFHVKVLPSDEALPIVYLDFDRENLAKLKAGEIAPEYFIRDHVDFN